MASTQMTSDNNNLSTLLQLEAEARRAESEKALQFLIVNETRRLLNYRQAFLLSTSGARTHRVEAASSLSVVDRNAPLIQWLETTAATLHEQDNATASDRVDANSLNPSEAARFEEFSLPYVVFVPLRLPDGQKIGGFWLTRETPWDDAEIVLIKRLSETYAHAWAALFNRKTFRRPALKTKWVTLGIVLGLILISIIPVRMSTIAPVEIVPLNPVIVSAPMDGVVSAVTQSPNTRVTKGDVVFTFEATNHLAAYQIATRAYDVASAKLRKATQGAFQDETFKGQVALLKTELALKETELAYAKQLLDQVEVTAIVDGLLVYSDQSDWTGKPVAIGQKMMEIVDPAKVQFRIQLPVNDAIVLAKNADVKVFLHTDPLTSIDGVVTRTSFKADLTPAGILAYRIDAEIINHHELARIGLQGSARVYGEKVSLFFYVFRRPISGLRQFIGL